MKRPAGIDHSRNESRFAVLPRLYRSTGESVSRSARLRVDSFMGFVSPTDPSSGGKSADLRVRDVEKQLFSEVLIGEEVCQFG